MNKQMTKVPVSELDSNIRNKNFQEVVLGYTFEEAIEESKRCLECKTKPCMKGCPVGIDIPEFIKPLKEGDVEKAYEVITGANSLPAICGRVCPQETQCEGQCVRGIKGEPVAIGRLERFVADYMESKSHEETLSGGLVETSEGFQPSNDGNQSSNEGTQPSNRQVAIIGSGPAGLTCASELAKAGISTTIFEALHKIGGVLTYGIPEFRLPKQLIAKEREKIEKLGVDIQTNTLIGKSYTIDQLKEQGYKAVFIGSGAGLPKFLGIEGENFNGVYSANEYLTRVNLMKAYVENGKTPIKRGQNVIVVGGGNVAMDAARTAKRLGAAHVHIVYRRSEEELPARLEEVHHAKEEGIEFNLLLNPTQILGEDFAVKEMVCQKMELGQADSSGRRRPVPVDGEFVSIKADTVIIAIGQTPNPLIKMTTPGIETFSWGGIKVNEETMATNLDGVYAGGDATTGAATVIQAMGAGKKAALDIKIYLDNISKNKTQKENNMSLQGFRVPKDIIFGENALEHLSTLEGKRATLVTGGSSMKRFGFLEEAQKQLEKAGMEVSIVDGVEPNPSIETVIRGGKEMEEFQPDWIIAIGGGSALDAAKIMWVYYEYPETEFDDLVNFKFPTLRTKAKFVAIPSTSGTASEITAFSVITDTANHIKYPLVSYEMTPDIALLDPAIPAKMPAHITANTGMDVMAHAVEAYVSTSASCYTDPLAFEAIRLVFNHLPKAFEVADDMPARDAMHNASALAGMAFTNSSLGLVHSLAHKIGGEFGITHGLANAILMPYIVDYNRKGTDKFTRLESDLHIENLTHELQELNKKVGIPLTLQEVTEVEITEEKFLEVLDRMSKNAFEDPCTLTNPRQSSSEDVRKIYECAFYGKSALDI